MADRYQQLVNTPIGKLIAGQVGLPSAADPRSLPPRAAC